MLEDGNHEWSGIDGPGAELLFVARYGRDYAVNRDYADYAVNFIDS
jgi:hypothetical protein